MTRRSPYRKTEGKPSLIPSFVCYADMLGYESESRAALQRNEGAMYLAKLRAVLNSAYRNIRRSTKGTGFRLCDLKIFTDNIVIGYPISDIEWTAGESELGHIFGIFRDHQVSLATQGIFVRGGIARGLHYMDSDIVFGDALLEAAKMDKTGRPPCLALAPSAIELVRRQIGFYAAAEGSPHYRALLQDSDGTIFINYLDAAFELFSDTGQVFTEILSKHRYFICQNLERFREAPRIRTKYEWLARYHNFVCQEFPSGYSITADLYEYLDETMLDKYLISVDELGGRDPENMPRRISLELLR